MRLSSPEFRHGESIPSRFTCDGANINPELHIDDVPPGALSLALIMDDPDAVSGVFVHWLLWNIAVDTAKITEKSVPGGVIEGMTSYNRNGYGGPCPPSGTHRYFFRLYALDSQMELDRTADRYDLDEAMDGHIVAQAELLGLYRRLR